MIPQIVNFSANSIIRNYPMHFLYHITNISFTVFSAYLLLVLQVNKSTGKSTEDNSKVLFSIE